MPSVSCKEIFFREKTSSTILSMISNTWTEESRRSNISWPSLSTSRYGTVQSTSDVAGGRPMEILRNKSIILTLFHNRSLRVSVNWCHCRPLGGKIPMSMDIQPES
jgi:hypothetical protein